MKKIILGLAAVILLGSCDFFVGPQVPVGKGNVTISVGTDALERAALSEELTSTFRYEFTFTGPGDVPRQTLNPGDKPLTLSLAVGQWTIEAEAYDDKPASAGGNGREGILAGSGSIVYPVIAGPNLITVPMKVSEGYPGTEEPPLNDAKAITEFSFAGIVQEVIISEDDHTIKVFVPYGINVTSLSPIITHTGVSIIQNAGSPNNAPSPVTFVNVDFTNPVTYTVMAEDGSRQPYAAMVIVDDPPLNDAKAITEFSFVGIVQEVIISEDDHTIKVFVPYGTNRTSLSPIITHTGVSITQNEGSPNNAPSPVTFVNVDFTNPVTYTVMAEDGTRQLYAVTVIEEDAPPDTFVPVTGITGTLLETTVGTSLTLTGAVEPDYATNQTIIWSITNAGNTGAVLASDGHTLSATGPGTVVVTATITDGIATGTDYTESFTIEVTDNGGGDPGTGGVGTITFTFEESADESFTLPENQTLSWTANTLLNLTVGGNYERYQWYLDTLPLDNTGASLSISANQLELGIHNLTVRVTKDGIPYSKELKFTVEE
jgi:hypothetical protein